MATISFSVRQRVTALGLPVQMQINFAGQRIRFNTGIHVSDKNNFVGGRLTPKETNYTVRNMKFAKILTALETNLLEKHTVLELKSYVKALLSDTQAVPNV